jgi:glycerol kinase
MTYILSIDAGTTGVTLLLINKKAEVVAKAYSELQQYHPQPAWVEHDPIELINKINTLIQQILQNNNIQSTDIAAIGITNQRETVIIWDKRTGQPIHNAIVWQCRRTTERCHELKQQGHQKTIKEKTGLVLDPYFSATKIEWLLKNTKHNRGDLICGTIDTWLVWNLTKEKAHVTDTSNASRTMLCNIHTKTWDDEILQLFNIPKKILPTIVSSSEVYGHIVMNNHNIPVAGIAGDQQAALFGQCCFTQGESKNTYGTGCFTLFNTGTRTIKSNNLLTTVAWTINNETYYALEGSVFVAGAAVQWLRDGLEIINDAAETEKLAKSLESNEDVYFVPALTGLGCPYWDPNARGTLLGLTRATSRAHIARAALESIAYQTKDIIETMQSEAEITIKKLKADGGATANTFLMQFQADILNTKVVVPQTEETTALGAAFLAGLAVGFWKNQEELRATWQAKDTFTPKMPKEQRDALYQKWKDAVKRSRDWSS